MSLEDFGNRNKVGIVRSCLVVFLLSSEKFLSDIRLGDLNPKSLFFGTGVEPLPHPESVANIVQENIIAVKVLSDGGSGTVSLCYNISGMRLLTFWSPGLRHCCWY